MQIAKIWYVKLMQNIEQVKKLRFKKHLALKEIGRILNITQQAVSLILIKSGGTGGKELRRKKLIYKCKNCSKMINIFYTEKIPRIGSTRKFCSPKCRHLHSLRCKKCGKSLIGLPKSYINMCRECSSLRMREYNKTKSGKKVRDESRRKNEKKFPEKSRARAILNFKLQTGHIKKPKNCSRCKKPKEIQAHHEDYSKPLEVKWYCRQCHMRVHNRGLEILSGFQKYVII